MKRKNIAVCTAVILTLSLLAGCGKNTETNSGATAGASGTEAAQAVSYTHLDVYKRQYRSRRQR